MWLDVVVRGGLIGTGMALVWLATRPWMWDVWRSGWDHIDDGVWRREDLARREGKSPWESR